MLPLPDVDGVRLAQLEDLPRISLVAAASFFWSPTFHFQRPRYKEFAIDTTVSYLTEYEAAIKDPSCVVLVAEDELEQDEADDVYEALRAAYPTRTPRQKGIVGVCSISLRPNSYYIGQCQSPADPRAKGINTSVGRQLYYPVEAELSDLKRDQSAAAKDIYNAVTGPVKLEHLAGLMRLSTLAVAPSYWHRGHAARLVSFCTQLADSDSALLGVSATPLGRIVVEKAGFQQRAVIRVKRPSLTEPDEGLSGTEASLWIGVRVPEKSPTVS